MTSSFLIPGAKMLNRLAKELGCVGGFKQPDPPWALPVAPPPPFPPLPPPPAAAAAAAASPTVAVETVAAAVGAATPSELGILTAEQPCKEHPTPASSQQHVDKQQQQHELRGAVVQQACVLLPADGSDRLGDQSTVIAELNQVLLDCRKAVPRSGDDIDTGAVEDEVPSESPALLAPERAPSPAPAPAARRIVCIVAQSSYDAWCASRTMPLEEHPSATPPLASLVSRPSDGVYDEQSKRLLAPPPFPFHFHRTIAKGTDLLRAESLLLNGTTVRMCVRVCVYVCIRVNESVSVVVWTLKNRDGLHPAPSQAITLPHPSVPQKASCKEPALKVPYVVLTTWTPLEVAGTNNTAHAGPARPAVATP